MRGGFTLLGSVLARLRDQEDHQETDPPVAAFGCFSLGPICDTPQWIGTTRLNYICMALGMIIAVLAESRPVLVKHPESVQSETETRLSENASESTMRPRPLKSGLESSLEQPLISSTTTLAFTYVSCMESSAPPPGYTTTWR